MKIDSHQHFWHYVPEEFAWIDESMAVLKRDFLPGDLKPIFKANYIDGSVLVQTRQSEEETEFLLDIAERTTFVKAVVGWVDLNSNAVAKRLKNFAANPYFKGVRHTVWDKEGEFMLDEDFQNGIQELQNLGLSYDLLVLDYQIPKAIQLVKSFPQLRFVINHLGKPAFSAQGLSAEWKQNIRELAKNENVFCKLTGWSSLAKDIQRKETDLNSVLAILVDAFGVERLMFGSDWPVCLSAASYRQVLELQKKYFSKLSEKENKMIFGENAAEFYRI